MGEKGIGSWREMLDMIGNMDEEQLRAAINHEVSTYCRKTIIERLHMRFERLRSLRERAALVRKEMLL